VQWVKQFRHQCQSLLLARQVVRQNVFVHVGALPIVFAVGRLAHVSFFATYLSPPQYRVRRRVGSFLHLSDEVGGERARVACRCRARTHFVILESANSTDGSYAVWPILLCQPLQSWAGSFRES
jgi:hypothetical protein